MESSPRKPGSSLPIDIMCEILSRTSPFDVARYSAVSKFFKYIVDLEDLWKMIWENQFQQEGELLSAFPIIYNSKKELFQRLCRSHIMLTSGELSFYLDKKTGKNCILVGARELKIGHVFNPMYWRWISDESSRFSEVSLVHPPCMIHIQGKMKAHLLSKDASYGVYLKFKKDNGVYTDHNDPCIIPDGFVKTEPNNWIRKTLVLHGRGSISASSYPVLRDDGWLEIEIGGFCNNMKEEEVVVSVRQTSNASHYGLIFEGIEFRPKMQSLPKDCSGKRFVEKAHRKICITFVFIIVLVLLLILVAHFHERL